MSNADIDSIRAAARLAQSGRLRSLLAWLGALLLPLAGGGVGYAAKALETRSGYELLRTELQAARADVAALRIEVAVITGTERKVLQIGKQAAFATAAATAYESDKVKRQKQSWAKSYAASYEKLVHRDGLSPDAAYALLFEQVAVP